MELMSNYFNLKVCVKLLYLLSGCEFFINLFYMFVDKNEKYIIINIFKSWIYIVKGIVYYVVCCYLYNIYILVSGWVFF